MSPQRPDKDTPLPDLPEQDMSIVFGGPCTSALVFTVSEDVPPLITRAVIDLVNWYLDDCHAEKCGKINDRVTSATNDGVTYTLGDPEQDRSDTKSIQLVESLYGCGHPNEFWHGCLDEMDPIRDIRWVCCEDLDSLVV